MHKVLAQNARSQAQQPPVSHQSNRDELRYQLRNKISKQDYVDKNLNKFHYNNTLTKMQSQQNLNKEELTKQAQQKIISDLEQKNRRLEQEMI